MILTWLILFPIAGAVAVALVPRERRDLIRALGLAASLVALAVAAWLFAVFQPGLAGMQFEERVPWVPGLGITYHLGVDGISILLVGLTAVLFPVSLLASWDSIQERVKEFNVLMLLLEAAILGTFLALDLILFYVFWEAVLVPMYFLIGLWGGERRTYAAVKFILYTMAGSVLMLVAIIVLYLVASPSGGRTFDLLALQQARLEPGLQTWLFLAFALAFAIKVPVWPFHTWLPDAHVEAPTAGSVILAGVLLKMGTYGFLRFALPLFPQASRDFVALASVLAVIGILYGGAVAWAQGDVKRLVAYSSVSHLGFVMLGMFSLTLQGVQGSILQMVNHGVSTGALFLIVGVLYDRTHSRMMEDYGGVAKLMPSFAAIVLLVTLSSAALPGTNGFVGEFLILLGTFRANPVYAAVAAGGVILSAVYLLWMVQRVMHGPVTEKFRHLLPDVNRREVLVFVPLLLLILWMGIYPKPFLSRTEASVQALLAHVQAKTTAFVPQREGPP
ncbi:MAG: NADH-quinone oxidoreductase subunit M [Armatimonadetes bacterium]|nr:NADH-quinone oxidoreductase subunit M [Armatimonadota bacterium]